MRVRAFAQVGDSCGGISVESCSIEKLEEEDKI